MRRFLGPLLAVLVGVGVVAGVFLSARDALQGGASALISVRGLIGSEKEEFYRDPRVQAAFARLGMKVEVLKSGSREMTTRPDLGKFDFGHPAGAPAAQRLKQVVKAQQLYTPFFTPMVIASWKKLVPLLEINGLVSEQNGTYYVIDMKRLLDMTHKGTRWRELKDNNVYDSGRAILISSTDVRTSNSAGMYMALASYVFNGNDVVQSNEDVDRVLPDVSKLFLKQGYMESSSAGPFADYVSMGMGKAPLVMAYESQFLSYQAGLASPNPEMVLLYPRPTVFSKHVFVPFNEKGARLGDALEHDPELQKLAAEYGFRGADPTHFTNFLKQKKLFAPDSLNDVVDPPTYGIMERMIDGIASRFN